MEQRGDSRWSAWEEPAQSGPEPWRVRELAARCPTIRGPSAAGSEVSRSRRLIHCQNHSQFKRLLKLTKKQPISRLVRVMKRESCRLIESPAVWSVLVAPVRAEIVEALRLLGPCSLAEIGDAINRPADSLYKHLQLLQEAGYVTQVGFRKGSRNVEQLVDVVADDFMINFRDDTGSDENKAIVTTANSFLKAVGRAVRDSAQARQLVFQADQRNIAINYELSWLTPEAFQEVRGLIHRLKQLMDDGKKRREGRLYMSLVVATPVTRRRGARERGSQPKQPSGSKRSRRAPAKKRTART